MFETVVEELQGSLRIAQVSSREGFPAGVEKTFVGSFLQVVLPESAEAAFFE